MAHSSFVAPLDGTLPVIWTVSVSRLTGLLADVIPEFDQRARIEQINLGFAEAVEVIGQRLRRERCDVLVAGGSNAAYLRSRLPLPLAPIQATGFDLMEALARARRIAPRIGVVTHATDVPSFQPFQDSFALDIAHRRFVTAEDARDCIADLRASGIQVIVGTGMAIDFAEQAGLPGVLLYSADSVRLALDQAIALATAPSSAAPALRNATRRTRNQPAALLGEDTAMVQVRALVQLYAPHASTVLISGETGTGKELVARQLHAGSRRRGRFVAINCGAITESLLEAELFGYSDGAFTGARRGGHTGLIEAAQDGTLFLDEIGELPLPLQTRLLRVLEEREVLRVGATVPVPVDVRVVAASLQPLQTLVDQGRFRRDLFYRLAALRIDLPPLRNRPDDIALLLTHYAQHGSETALPLSPAALQRLQQHAWPGNVRELRNLVERLCIHWKAQAQGQVSLAQLEAWAPELADASTPAGYDSTSADAASSRAHLTATLVRAALERAQGNRASAAKALGVSRTTLWRWMQAQELASSQ
ncbi:propionate catabolism operon regulatory protein PrpR [Xanthomonas campestris pv. campestris]|uniref:propionate catabolism operon regulatory protein PrpR n=1 Tax=Xanthomonas campestris TaxID=339 RepID=UPI00226A64CE|nr:propionate catabolism operon regulatory protein PrpR [Xanthomonas campestris]MDO0789516.1 propionate catabolism operon regulatory protein PrpR [Xanthomonas campestris pv. campestris]MDO0840206.1 propionate catabolism operon regulatory protein PrpR [Xanthomonas campestris pv. campestris]MEB1349887.1 propionate catabolism operon regulatory protein PrpR [Xanthomonas campestris pv. campestris]MEB1361043.1 propionate catabolism operon regulatory protein PrpR [Xanthomonas campestris pv. campestris